MAQATVVYTSAQNGSSLSGNLFEGRSFWVAQRVPQRSHLVEQIQSNGGTITKLEDQADVKLVDHMRKDAPPGCHSFKYVTESVRKGALEDLDSHAVGQPTRAPRPGGSLRPGKSTRIDFTAADDRLLYKWVTDQERQGKRIMGNEIYKRLEEFNPRHTFHSWRDRWVKTLSHRPPPSSVNAEADAQDELPSPPLDTTNLTADEARAMQQQPASRADFTRDDFKYLLDIAGDIVGSDPASRGRRWETVAEQRPSHTGEQWQQYFQTKVLPIYKDFNEQPSATSEPPTTQSSDTKSASGGRHSSLNGRPSRTAPEATRPLAKKADVQQEASAAWREVPASPSAPETSQGRATMKRKRRPSETGPGELQEAESTPRKDVKTVRGPAAPPVPIEKKEKSKQNLAQEPASAIDEREIPSTPEEATPRSNAEKLTTSMPSAALAPNGEEEEEETEEEDLEDEDQGEPSQEAGESPTLNEPRHPVAKDTQAVLFGQTQALDIGLAPPEGGWDENSAEENDEGEEDDHDGANGGLTSYLSAGLSTPPDEIPNPSDEAAEPPPRQTVSQDEDPVGDWIDSHITPNTPEETVIKALKCTCADLLLAERVLTSIRNGNGIPTDVPGVWLPQDDEQLQGSDSRALAHLHQKHGTDYFNKRWKYLPFFTESDEAGVDRDDW